ncbi:MAG: peptide ABC transporter substrate-binding protein [Treponema sp.]|jgi:peptide/nickel transport system substrate-binding protein/oligopeptide transport system substrate-binding protein|nr:peptide ABC transporter substrate-binding protein [Treponema sp.]
MMKNPRGENQSGFRGIFRASWAGSKFHPAGILLRVLWTALLISACRTPPVPSARSAEPPAETGPLIPAPEPGPGPDFAETRPRVVIRDELTAVFTKGDVELDFRKSYLASEAQIFTGLYEGLFSYHPYTMEPVPAAAEKWDLSDDKKQWTFTIRANARYWNGDPLRAEDFRAAWISLLDPKRSSPYSSLFDVITGAREYRTGIATDPSQIGIETRGDNTLIVRLTSPASFFPSMLCHHSFSPIHPSMVDKENWSLEPPLSNGPFRIGEQTGERIALEKNLNYWDASRVSLNRVILKFSEDGDEASNLWNSGEARWISGDVNLDTLTDRSGIQVNPMFATHYYYIRSAEKPWSDHRVRRALSLVLPWDELREGHYLPAKTLIFPIPGYPEIEGLDTTDEEEAKQLLTEAGYPQGLGLPDLVIKLTPSMEAARIGGLMASAWKEKLGVPVRIEVVPYGQYFQALKDGGYEVAFSTWIGDFADPYTFLQMWRRDSNLNDAGYDDADYENLIEKSMNEEGEQRWSTLAEAEKLLLYRGSVLPISYSPAINIVDINELDGWFPNALDIHPFKYLSFKAFRPLPGVVLAK